MDAQLPVPRKTLAQVCQNRARALEKFEEAYHAIAAADEALKQAREALRHASPAERNRYNYEFGRHEDSLWNSVKLMDRDAFLTQARKVTDVSVWSYLIELTDLEKLMDKKAKDELSSQLRADPPEATEETVIATLKQFMLDADIIFRRGIAECFSSLDRRFRSHDGWKIGSRVILSYAFDESGYWNHYRAHRDTLIDIERTFMVLDGKPVPPVYHGIVAAVEKARGGGWGRRQSECETKYFKIRCYMNGNAHVWFKRDDLVAKVNKLLGEYYGEVIPEDREPDEDTGLFNPKTTPAKRYGFYPSPEPVAETVVENAPLWRRDDEPKYRVLEPSAGTGNLARLCVKRGAIVDCVEIQPDLAGQLRAEGIYRRVVNADFLALRPDPDGLYDRIMMNPPFDRERDIDHVMHALNFLKPDGHLTAVMSAGTEFRETRKSTAFRELMTKLRANWRDLPAGSFASVGTYCNTVVLSVWKDGRRQ